MLPRPRSFGTKLLVLFLLVVAAAQLLTWVIVTRFHRNQARALIEEELLRAAHAFQRVIEERNALLAAYAVVAARDYPMKSLFVADDPATLASALSNFQSAGVTDIASALSLDGQLLASTSRATTDRAFHVQLIARAEASPGAHPTAVGYGYVGDQLHSLFIAPVRAPDIIAWLMIGFRIDETFVRRLKDQTGVEVTFFDHGGRLLASTLPETTASALTQALPRLRQTTATVSEKLGHDTALVLLRLLPAGSGLSAALALQYSLDEKLRPARAAERWLLAATSIPLLLALFLSRAFTRTLTRPITALVGQARRIGRGDYNVQHTAYRRDELGRLSEAFDQMARGLAERDHVRDLLDKNVSPEVAAQLVRDGAALGGEEREVTILFADLRGFTSISEKLPPHDLLALLNRYLDRMSAEIERQGGVIDKFIGDEIMALFGAPVAQSDAADRAIAAALAMQQALLAFNAELAAEAGKPQATSAGSRSPVFSAGLALGIGINTARVIAGNIGSHRRLNYSVIGDGVNVAARLQSLTRTPGYNATLIASASTLAAVRDSTRLSARPLGPVQVKGRDAPVEIFAIT